MLSHSSHTARLDPGKDRGRRGDAKWGRIGQARGAVRVGVRECSAGGKEGDVIQLRSCRVVVISLCVCVCVTDLEPDGVAGVVEVMRSREMCKDDQWQASPATQKPFFLGWVKLKISPLPFIPSFLLSLCFTYCMCIFILAMGPG